ncbi:Gpi1-domain-containing protein [Dendrothele bispora CBS 962.96]|uniref:Gpi1-domain-containing protein n=1 Tax=Dendrothele bispora (strain CBS 962.96) TaxID=1314807 RepID=A0A4S8L9G3_DENBC|nr:Gpi1-domain-containing protein [Dendrothele bispora CBS 962.96]
MPSLHFDCLKSKYNIVFYHKHAPNTLRYHSLVVHTVDEPKAKANRPGYALGGFAHEVRLENNGINDRVVDQFNAAGSIDALLQPHRPPARSFLASTIHDLFQNFLGLVYAIVSSILGIIARTLNAVCNTPIFRSWNAKTSYHILLKDVSATIQQIDIRAEQAGFLVSEASSLKKRGTIPTSVYSMHYTNFFNNVWLILNDITIGYAFGSFLCDNHVVLANFLSTAVDYILIDWIQWVLRWLDSWPAGLKLNTELSRFYSHTFVDLVAMWGSVLHRGFTILPVIIYVIGILSSFGGVIGGMTMSISLFSDLLSLSTVHIYVCYVIANTVYGRVLVTAGSLWNLFRGKRYNVLRKRTDSWEYETDQLLFGTILFTLLAFLFPTVLAYYSLFALMRLATILIQASLETQLAFMNHFPLFAIMLRAKDPRRLPGGIYFVFKPSTKEDPIPIIENQAVPFSSIFFQYIQLWSRLATHYNPLRLLKCVFAGEFLAPIPRYEMRYSKTRFSPLE